MAKDHALQKAKLEFLRNADPAQANPFYWGSFVVMGNTEPIEIENDDVEWWSWVVGVLIVITLAVIVRKRRSGMVGKVR